MIQPKSQQALEAAQAGSDAGRTVVELSANSSDAAVVSGERDYAGVLGNFRHVDPPVEHRDVVGRPTESDPVIQALGHLHPRQVCCANNGSGSGRKIVPATLAYQII